jgi:ACS family hexuronate transporter-like MFS transporter
MLGLAEPGLFPVTMRTATVWVEDKGRGFFMALGTIGTTIGGITAVPIIAWLTIHLHWRWAFVFPGVLGVFIALAWWKLYREPERPAAIMAAEPAAASPPLPWSRLWNQRALWGIVLVRLVSDPVWYFVLFWMPGYLQESKGVSIGLLGTIGWIPFLCATVGGLGFTVLSDYRAKKQGLDGRKRLVMATALVGPLCWMIPHASIGLTIVLFCIIAILCNAWLGSLAPMIAQLFPVGNVASVYGISGAFGASGAVLFNYLIGQAAGRFGMEPIFFAMGLLHPLAAVIMFLLVRQKRFSPAPLSV